MRAGASNDATVTRGDSTWNLSSAGVLGDMEMAERGGGWSNNNNGGNQGMMGGLGGTVRRRGGGGGSVGTGNAVGAGGETPSLQTVRRYTKLERSKKD